jgi:hypothetical protein
MKTLTLNEKDLGKGNRLIAAFMGTGEFIDGEYHHRGPGHFLYFHTSWDSLMEVVKKIESLDYFCTIYRGGVEIVEHGCEDTLIKVFDFSDRINNLWKACVQFIEWHNMVSRKLPDASEVGVDIGCGIPVQEKEDGCCFLCGDLTKNLAYMCPGHKKISGTLFTGKDGIPRNYYCVSDRS